MKVYDITDDEGRIFAFEVDNTPLGRQGAWRVVRAIAGARVIRRPRRFWLFDPDEFCEFELDGVRFVVEEPWGDNSRYWIGPTPPRWVPQTAIVRDAFGQARVGGWFRR